jgi:hypothetical protein
VRRRALADVDDFGGLREALDDVGADQGVDGDEVGGGDELRGADGEEAGVAGAGADQKDFADHEFSPS